MPDRDKGNYRNKDMRQQIWDEVLAVAMKENSNVTERIRH